MTPDMFRRIALALPEATESSHLGTPDFRVRKNIFATLGAALGARCVVKLTLEQQAMFQQVDPAAFAPVDGGWGRKGWTCIHLGVARPAWVGDAVAAAWRNVAPRKLVATLDAPGRAV